MALKGLDWHRGEINACLSIGQPELAGVEIDMLPSQLLYLGQPAAGQHQEADGRFDPEDIDEQRIRGVLGMFAACRRGPLASHRSSNRGGSRNR